MFYSERVFGRNERVHFSWIKRQLQNVKSYQKRKTDLCKRKSTEDANDHPLLDEKELEEPHAMLLREVKKKTVNKAAVKGKNRKKHSRGESKSSNSYLQKKTVLVTSFHCTLFSS